MAKQFSNTNNPVEWAPKAMHIRCAVHNMALVVKDALAHLDVSVGNIKPSTFPGVNAPYIMLKNIYLPSNIDIAPDFEYSNCAGHVQYQADTENEEWLSEANEPTEVEEDQ